MSNVRNTWSQNSSALPLGKNILYMSTNLAGVKRPFGQSCCKNKNWKFSLDERAFVSSNNSHRLYTLPTHKYTAQVFTGLCCDLCGGVLNWRCTTGHAQIYISDLINLYISNSDNRKYGYQIIIAPVGSMNI